MAHRLFRENFDRDRDFVALRGFVFSAQAHVPGQRIDKGQFTVRRLRQLFDARCIGYPEESSKAPRGPVEAEVVTKPPQNAVETPVRGATSRVPRRRLQQPAAAIGPAE